MNVNGARFQMLFGRQDWSRCRDRDGRPLADWWDGFSSPMPQAPADLPAWDEAMSELSLRPQPIELPATSGEMRLDLQARRSADADRHGNVYRIADDARSLRVTSAGSGAESEFWPALAIDRGERISSFQTHAAAAELEPDRYLCVAVSHDDYLIVAFARGASRGVMSFDLISGGPPLETAWPSQVPFEPFALCARHGGGAWVLDRAHRQLWELDCTLAVVNSGQPMLPLPAPAIDDFQPLSGPPRAQPPLQFPGGLDLNAIATPLLDPIAIQSHGPGRTMLLDRDLPQSRSRVVRLSRDGAAWSADASQWLDLLPAPAHDMVYASGLGNEAAGAAPRLFVASQIGNQVHAFEVLDDDDGFALRAPAELYPLRRYGGRALLALGGMAYYDSGPDQPRWTPVVQQHQHRYAAQAVLITPAFDSEELGTVWDKLLFDGGVPPDTEVIVDSRAGDELDGWFAGETQPAHDAQVIGEWLREPSPRLRRDGPELPWLRREAARRTRREAGAGTWELLLQRARGRYLQLRLTLVSRNGTGTPRLRALRLWAPRFSYPQRFLPAVYREDVGSGEFLERWLANCESTLTEIEDRVVQVESLFDARSVPHDALPWLAGWFDLALDPAWDERRHRLLVRHAMDFFRWRGTVHGLRLALAMAFEIDVDAAMFEGPRDGDEGAGRIRIVESYQTRLVETLIADAAARAGGGPRAVQRQSLWTPAEGNAGLADRYAAWLGRPASALEQITAFSLAPPGDENAAQQWRSFALANLGFVPAAGAAERQRWRVLLQSRYPQIDALNRAHGSHYADFDALRLPALPAQTQAAREDWLGHCARNAQTRERRLWQDFLARRYRRIERLRGAYRAAWADFEQIPVPDALPATLDAQTDWLQFERQLLAMHRTAHRFSVLLPVASVIADPYALEQKLALARRIVELEKPAHTVFDVRFYWAFNRVGEARLGLDTQLGAGSRASELIPDAVVGRAYLGASFIGGPARLHGRDRLSLDC
ncbi:phage tail protein [Lysobacter sp. CA199]|uniref:phage tail protein n=1 Tax=Lysobacter sp. CA199 TaxID=3455608 RepID=UPI003F8D2EA4